MRRVQLFAAFIILVQAISLNAAVTDWSAVAAKAGDSIVYITSSEGSCSGFVVNADALGNQDYILTAAHCDVDAPEAKLYADHVPAFVVWKDAKKDIMIVAVHDTGRPALHFAKENPVLGQEVASYGYGDALERPMFRLGHVSDEAAQIPGLEGGPFIMIDAAFVGGQSGCPVINAAGEVVLIVQRASDRIGLGIGTEAIKKAAGRYFEKGKP